MCIRDRGTQGGQSELQICEDFQHGRVCRQLWGPSRELSQVSQLIRYYQTKPFITLSASEIILRAISLSDRSNMYVSYHKHHILRQIKNNHHSSLTAISQVHVAELLQAHWHWSKGWIKSFPKPLIMSNNGWQCSWPDSIIYIFIFINLFCIRKLNLLLTTFICNFNWSKNAHVLDGNAPDLEAECADYERKIAEVFYHLIIFLSIGEQHFWPKAGGIELFIWGIGPDGHIAFNEPGSSLVSRTRVCQTRLYFL